MWGDIQLDRTGWGGQEERGLENGMGWGEMGGTVWKSMRLDGMEWDKWRWEVEAEVGVEATGGQIHTIEAREGRRSVKPQRRRLAAVKVGDLALLVHHKVAERHALVPLVELALVEYATVVPD